MPTSKSSGPKAVRGWAPPAKEWDKETKSKGDQTRIEIKEEWDEEDWDEIAKSIPNKTPVQCLKRYMSLNKKGQEKGTPESVPPVPVVAAAPPPPLPASGDDALDSPEMLPPPAKKPRKDPDPSSKWTSEEIELLKKLVEQYKDSKLVTC